MNCKYCGKAVTLMPSAAERSKVYGESPEYYIKAFPYHTDCFIADRSKQSIELMRRSGYGKPASTKNIA